MRFTSPLLLLLLVQPLLLFAQLEPDFISQIATRYNSGSSLSSLGHIKPVASTDGGTFVVGRDGGGFNYDLVFGEDEQLVEGRDADDYFVAKFDQTGAVAWAKRFSGSAYRAVNEQIIPRIVAAPDGGVFLLSYVRFEVALGTEVLGNSSEQRQLIIVKLDGEGGVEYTHFLPSSTRDFHKVQLARNGDLLLSGRAEDFQLRLGNESVNLTSDPAFFVARISPEDGEVHWLSGISATEEWLAVGTAYGLLETRDGKIVVSLSPAGPSFRINGCRDEGKFGLRVASLNGDDGAINWLNKIMAHDFGYISDISESPDGDLYVVGEVGGLISASNGETTFANPADCNDRTGFLLKLYADGTTYDLLHYRDGFLPANLVMQPNGNYTLVGETYGVRSSEEEEPDQRYQLRYYDRYDIPTETYGLPAWSSTYYKSFLAMSPGTDSRSILVSGRYDWSDDPSPLNTDSLFFGESIFFVAQYPLPDAPDIRPTVQEEQVVLFPNPTSGLISLHTPGGTTAGWRIQLTDMSGRRIDTQVLDVDRSQQTFDLSKLPSGIYHLTVWGNERVFTRRVVVR